MSEVRGLSRRPGRMPDLPQGTLRRERGGFALHTPTHQPVKLTWGEIVEVRAFKMDLISRDLVCISVIHAGPDGMPTRSVQLHEDMPGWYTLLEELSVNLAGCRQDWWAEVAFPAFASNERVIYKRVQTPRVTLAKA